MDNNYAAPMGYVNDAVAKGSELDRQWVIDNIHQILYNAFPSDADALIIEKLREYYDIPISVTTIDAAVSRIAMRQYSTYTNDIATSVPQFAFNFNQSLYSISMPNATAINAYAFGTCSNLRNIDFPKLTIITSQSAFQSCTNLLNVSLPSVTTIGATTFEKCTNLRELSCPKLTTLQGTNQFQNCPNLRIVYMPLLTTFSSTPFYNSTSLRQVTFGWSLPASGGYTLPACPRLMKYSLGRQYRANCDLSIWNPTYVNTYPDLADEVIDTDVCSTNREQIDYSARQIADFMLPLETAGQFTIKFSTTVYNCLTTETLDAFTNKNWAVAH